MMMNKICWGLLFLLVAMSCSRPQQPPSPPPCQLSYGDSIFYVQDTGSYVIMPADSQVTSGRYVSRPEGLDINERTGAIDVNNSESGLRYNVSFIPDNGGDSCSAQLTVSGIDYLDSVYVLQDHDTTALPVYDGDAAKPLPCGDDDDDECEFDDDEDDDDGDGDDDEPPPGQDVRSQGLAINTASGHINLKQTVANGTFGATPVSGRYKDLTIYYRLFDASQGALNRITIRVYYFNTKGEIPASLMDELEDKRKDARMGRFNTAGGSTAKVQGYAPKRPPYIIIVRRVM
jgi:hypothetical protein